MKNLISKNYLNKVYLNFKSIEEIRGKISEAINVCLKSIKRKNLHLIKVKANRDDRIQEQHIAIGHIICEFLENSC